MRKTLFLTVACLAIAASAAAQQFDFPEAAATDAALLAKVLPPLAAQVIAAYRDDDRRVYLDNLCRLQIVAGQYEDALGTLASLQPLDSGSSPQAGAKDLEFAILVRARMIERTDGLPFDEAFRRAFRDAARKFDDRTAAFVMRTFVVPERSLRQDLDDALAKHKGKSTLSLADAVALIRAYQIDAVYRAFGPLIDALIAEDDQRRYVVEKDIFVKTPDGAAICAQVIRPRGEERLPALMEFTIYNSADPTLLMRETRRAASNGYASVVGFTRGKACSPGQPVPYEHDGADAATLIDWIITQPWSDGRVGMYGGSYSGFTPWAAAKHKPKGLKAIVIGAPAAPGVDVPMEGNVTWNFIYPWPFYTTNNKTLDDATYGDAARWRRLDHDWYVSGRPYRDLDKIDGTPNPVFDRWIAHPSYDAYWQSMLPYKSEFATIDIPVLSTAGYYYGGPGAAVYYFTQHLRYQPGAEHYLVIGPYDHFQAQSGTITSFGGHSRALAGYPLDSVALTDLTELRYRWFDYVFKGAPKPALLQDKVNYQVTGANVWKHAPSIAAMADRMMRFHLTAERSGNTYQLSEKPPKHSAFVAQTVNFADRSDADANTPGGGVLDKDLDTTNGFAYISAPFTKGVEMSGLFAGRLDFVTNKRDFDFNIGLFALTPEGKYMQLAPYWARASYVHDPAHRHLLTPGRRTRLDFRSIRLMSCQLPPGSRLVVVLQVIKESGRQINYGTGKAVNDESIADAKVPLRIKWFSDSYVDVPSHR